MSVTIRDVSARQIEREQEMLEDGLKRALKRDQAAVQREEQTRTEKLTLAALVPPAVEFLEALLASKDANTGGSKPGWYSILKAVDLYEVAAAAIHTAFACGLRDKEREQARHTWALRHFGQALEVIKAAHDLKEAAKTGKQRRRVASLPKTADSVRGRRKAILRAAEPVHEAWEPTRRSAICRLPR